MNTTESNVLETPPVPLAAPASGDCDFYADAGRDDSEHSPARNRQRFPSIAAQYAAGGDFLYADRRPADSFKRLFGGQVRH